jgi:hypothetical protein
MQTMLLMTIMMNETSGETRQKMGEAAETIARAHAVRGVIGGGVETFGGR